MLFTLLGTFVGSLSAAGQSCVPYKIIHKAQAVSYWKA